jgi:hydroxymethylglutaryl-CoA lyase
MMQTGINVVSIQEVAPRDGFQIEPVFIPTAAKIALIDRLSRTGLRRIEVSSFTSPKAIPTLADAGEVFRGITRVPSVTYAALVPNLRQCVRALAYTPDELNLVMSASDSHGKANLRLTAAQSLEQLGDIVKLVDHRTAMNLSISTAFGCPFEGGVPLPRLLGLIERAAELGLSAFTLCDTTGMANPAQVAQVFSAVLQRWPGFRFTAHFHDTRGLGLANALAAFQVGIRHFDASLGGLGGCPFAPGASGNVCTEDLVHMFEAMGVPTGIDLQCLLDAAEELPALVGHATSGQICKAGPATRRYALPETTL